MNQTDSTAVSAMKLIVIRTQKLESLREFLARLGLQFVSEKHGLGPLHYSTSIGPMLLEIYPSSTKHGPDLSRLGFYARDLHSLLANFESSEIETLPTRSEWGTCASLIAPDGRKIDLYQDDNSLAR